MAKRAIGEGSVRQRPNGLWEARLSYIDPMTGRRRSASFYGPTAEAARDELDRARDRVKAQVPVRDSSQRLADYIEHWSATSLEASPRKEKTKVLYRQLAANHLAPAPFGSTPLDRLRKTHIDGLVVALRKRGLSGSTVRLIYTVLRAILADAKLDGLVADNAAAKMPRPRVARTEARYLAASEVAAILTAAEGLRYRPVLALIAATGVRRGEALALRWEHVNLNDGTLKVAATLDSVGGEMLITEPKSPRARRTIPLSPAVIAILKAQRATQAAERLHAGNQWTDSGLVFSTELGLPVDPRYVHRTIKRAAAKAGIENVGVHTLRHSAAVAWLEAGVHIKAVADLLGHSSIAITGDIYGHTSDATTRAAVDGLTDALGL
jgi:integrase